VLRRKMRNLYPTRSSKLAHFAVPGNFYTYFIQIAYAKSKMHLKPCLLAM
jgi:hypothetical protein